LELFPPILGEKREKTGKKEEEEEGRTGRDEMRGSPYTQVNPLIGYTVFWEEK
jgi:hypothetical protein